MLYVSTPAVGEEHHKRFAKGVTPTNQATMNLYIEGAFELSIPSIGYSATMRPGDCSLDLDIAQYPEDLCIERCLESGSKRICLSPADRTLRWSRSVRALAAGEAYVVPGDSVAILMKGAMVLDNLDASPGSAVHLTGPTEVQAKTESRVAILQLT